METGCIYTFSTVLYGKSPYCNRVVDVSLWTDNTPDLDIGDFRDSVNHIECFYNIVNGMVA